MMTSTPGHSGNSPTDPLAGLVREELAKLLADHRFVRAERLSRFLRFTVEKTLEGGREEIKEYLIAIEVYGRPSSYDPAVDSLVRVEMSRLRAKLADYYSITGLGASVRIEYPKGQYAPVFIPLQTESPPEAPAPGEPQAPQSTPTVPDRLGVRRIAVWGSLLLLVLCAAGAGLLYRTRRTDTAASIAVLPFACFSTDPDAVAFAAGLTEELTARLSQNPDLRVAARTSAQSFENKATNVVEIGRELNVGMVLEGSVRKDDGGMRITAQLVSTTDGFHLWSQTYDREMRERTGLQDELARMIAAGIVVQAANRSERPGPSSTSAKARDITERAQRLLRKERGDHLLQGAGERDRKPLPEILAAVEELQQATRLDPGNGAAHAALGAAWLRAADYDETYWEHARAAATKAIALDPSAPAAHFVLGYIAFLRDWEFAAAAKALTRAIEIDPRDATASRLFADCAALTGNFEAGTAALERARKAMPDSPVIAVQSGIMLYHARQYAEMLNYANALAQSHSELPLAHWLLGLALEQMGRYPEAASALEQCLRLSPRDVRALPALGHVYAQMGKRNEALRLIESARGYSSRGWIGPTGIALIHTALGNKDAAFTWLGEAYRQREGALPYIKLDPRFDPLRSDRRFADLLRTLRL